jgi:hypothetical protein
MGGVALLRVGHCTLMLAPAEMLVGSRREPLSSLVDLRRVGELVGRKVHQVLSRVLRRGDALMAVGDLASQLCAPLARLLRELPHIVRADHSYTVGRDRETGMAVGEGCGETETAGGPVPGRVGGEGRNGRQRASTETRHPSRTQNSRSQPSQPTPFTGV